MGVVTLEKQSGRLQGLPSDSVLVRVMDAAVSSMYGIANTVVMFHNCVSGYGQTNHIMEE